MSNYSDIIKGNNTTVSGSIIPINATEIGTHISDSTPAEVGTFKGYGFEAVEGNLYNCDPSLGAGTGILTKASESLFPLTGNGKPYTIDVQVNSVTDGNFQLGLVAETSWPLPDQFFVGANGSKPDTTLWYYDNTQNIYIQDDQLRLYAETTDDRTIHVRVDSKFVLEGDFDVSIRHAYRYGISDNYLSALFHLYAAVGYSGSVPGQDWYFRHYSNGPYYIYYCPVNALSTSDWSNMVEQVGSYSPPNYYRSTRVGNVGSMYTSEDGTNWTLLYTGSGFSTAPVRLTIDTYRYNMVTTFRNNWDKLHIEADKVSFG